MSHAPVSSVESEGSTPSPWLSSGSGLLSSSSAVSYTHLDVYKRQPNDRMAALQALTKGFHMNGLLL